MQKSVPLLDPQVQNWINEVKTSSAEQLGVLVTAQEPLDDVSFLRKIKNHYYTGRLTADQIKQLLNDPRVKKISTGMSQMHEPK